ncbi:hypothetical protein [Sphingobacterium zeae]|uniref:Uncharacterized protein n=1 Tax=Sphingobacterium zeae TaxID=1776859 RepID=A0ABU0U8F1_9SPHI|nr:hypothetical protein [Sphingobacterium zeae]MDQ1150493.1 hypothetical protein [Sphingobacterium zeae]
MNDYSEKIRKILEKERGGNVSEMEVEECENFLKLLSEITMNNLETEMEWELKLKQFPEGFQLDGDGRNCGICNQPMGKGKGWYDRYGLKCIVCQKALTDHVIPASLLKNKDSFYTETELNIFFNMKRRVLDCWIKKGIVSVRVIKDIDSRIHMRLFLLRDNKNFFPPKKLLRGGMHIEEKEGRQFYVFGPWYDYCDPLEVIGKYGIAVSALRTTCQLIS